MTYKIDVLRNPGGVTIAFEGRLDGFSLHELKSHSESSLRHATKVEILIRVGSEIDPAVLDDLVAIRGVTLNAESPYLVRWLKEKRGQSQD